MTIRATMRLRLLTSNCFIQFPEMINHSIIIIKWNLTRKIPFGCVSSADKENGVDLRNIVRQMNG